MMKVQRVRLADDSVTWIVLDDDHTPVQPILSYLKYLHNLDRSPNTLRATAHRLKLFWEYLRDERLCWREMNVAQLAAFIAWLRRLDPTVISIAPHKAPRTNATIDLALGAVYGFYSYQMRLGILASTSFVPAYPSLSRKIQALPAWHCPGQTRSHTLSSAQTRTATPKDPDQ